MDEEAREEFLRVKKVVEKKKEKLEREKREEVAVALCVVEKDWVRPYDDTSSRYGRFHFVRYQDFRRHWAATAVQN